MTGALRSAPDDLEQNHRRPDTSSLWGFPVALSYRIAAAIDTSAALVSLPGRVVDLVTVAEQALDQRASMAGRVADITQASDTDAWVNLVGRLPRLADAMNDEQGRQA